MSRKQKRTAIGVQFAARPIEMLESPAYNALSLSARRVLDRLEIELAHHGGTDNGKLPVTYTNFEDFGMDTQAIPKGIREVVALGFVEVTQRGRPSKSDFVRYSSLYRITWRHTADAPATNDWRRFKTREEANAVAKLARDAKDDRAVARSKSRVVKKVSAGGWRNPAVRWGKPPR